MCSVCQGQLEGPTCLTLTLPAGWKWLSATIAIPMFHTVLNKLERVEEINDGAKSEELVGVARIRESLLAEG